MIQYKPDKLPHGTLTNRVYWWIYRVIHVADMRNRVKRVLHKNPSDTCQMTMFLTTRDTEHRHLRASAMKNITATTYHALSLTNLPIWQPQLHTKCYRPYCTIHTTVILPPCPVPACIINRQTEVGEPRKRCSRGLLVHRRKKKTQQTITHSLTRGTLRKRASSCPPPKRPPPPLPPKSPRPPPRPPPLESPRPPPRPPPRESKRPPPPPRPLPPSRPPLPRPRPRSDIGQANPSSSATSRRLGDSLAFCKRGGGVGNKSHAPQQ